MLNRTVLVGRLTRDPDLRYTPNGKAVANFNIAVNRPFKDQNGENQADFINGVAWNKQAESLANYMKKGSQIGVDGRLQSRTYEGQDGKTVFVTEVVADSIQFLETKNQTNQQQNQSYQQQQYNQQSNQQYNQKSNNQQQINAANQEVNRQADPFQNQGQPLDISDDDLPF